MLCGHYFHFVDVFPSEGRNEVQDENRVGCSCRSATDGKHAEINDIPYEKISATAQSRAIAETAKHRDKETVGQISHDQLYTSRRRFDGAPPPDARLGNKNTARTGPRL